MENKFFTKKDLELIMTNPFYCITVDSSFTLKHEYMVTEEEWIKVNINMINEIGAKKWLKNLLENLKGNYK
jgi:hypothetical protein